MLNAAHLRRDTEARVVVGCAGAATTTLAAAIADLEPAGARLGRSRATPLAHGRPEVARLAALTG